LLVIYVSVFTFEISWCGPLTALSEMPSCKTNLSNTNKDIIIVYGFKVVSMATIFKLQDSLDSSDWLRLRGIAFLYSRIEDAALKPPNTVTLGLEKEVNFTVGSL